MTETIDTWIDITIKKTIEIPDDRSGWALEEWILDNLPSGMFDSLRRAGFVVKNLDVHNVYFSE